MICPQATCLARKSAIWGLNIILLRVLTGYEWGREEVHEEITSELEWKVEWYTDRLESLYKRQWGKPDEKRERLKERIETFYRELREERQKHWRDKQELEQDKRALLRELRGIMDDPLNELL